jgi:hypothetical protein
VVSQFETVLNGHGSKACWKQISYLFFNALDVQEVHKFQIVSTNFPIGDNTTHDPGFTSFVMNFRSNELARLRRELPC